MFFRPAPVHPNRLALWPQKSTFNDKLYDGLEQLTITAHFITSIGLVNFENEEEEEEVGLASFLNKCSLA